MNQRRAIVTFASNRGSEQKYIMRTDYAVGLLILTFCTSCFGWSTKEHILLTRLAAERLTADSGTPPAMKEWLRQAAPDMMNADGERRFTLDIRIGVYPRGAVGLSFWSTVPDLIALSSRSGDAAAKVEPFGVPERLLHFVDLEYFCPDESRRIYADDLSSKPALNDIPRQMTDPRWQRAGMLPFRIEQSFQEMIAQIRQGRLGDKPGQFPRDEHATKWAGMLAHYIEDNTQPHHATADYKSQAYFKDKLRSPNIHADMEYVLLDDDYHDYLPLREEFWAELQQALTEPNDPVQVDDTWVESVEVLRTSYDALPLIGHAAAAAYTREDGKWKFDADQFYHYQGAVAGKRMTIMRMKARQMAWAVQRVARLWRRAWETGRQ